MLQLFCQTNQILLIRYNFSSVAALFYFRRSTFMRKKLSLLIMIIMLFNLAACGEVELTDANATLITESAYNDITENTGDTEKSDETSSYDTAKIILESTDYAEAAESTESPTETDAPVPHIVELSKTYTVRITRGDFPIYSGPGYEYQQTATVQEAGIYTITAEYKHKDGELWGRLKSGVGWVNLTQVEEKETPSVEVSERYLGRWEDLYAGKRGMKYDDYIWNVEFRSDGTGTFEFVYGVNEIVYLDFYFSTFLPRDNGLMEGVSLYFAPGIELKYYITCTWNNQLQTGVMTLQDWENPDLYWTFKLVR